MAQSTRPASANGSARQDTRAAGRPARVRPTARSEALPEPRPRAQAMALPGRSRRQPCTRAGSRRRHLVRRNLEPRASRASEGRAAVADAGPDLIHDLRIYVRRLCALSDLLPRPPGARPMRRALRKEVAWAMPSRARDWDVFTMEVLPQLCDADPDIDPQARPRARARSEIARTTRCTPTCRPNASRPCCACSGNAARRSPPPWPSARPGRCIARSAAA